MTSSIEQTYHAASGEDCIAKAKCMAKATISALYDWHKEESALSGEDIDRLLDAVKILSIISNNSVAMHSTLARDKK